MGYAMLFPLATDKGGRGKKRARDLQGLSHTLLSQARTVHEHAPTPVEKVRDGFPLSEVRRVGLARRQSGAHSARLSLGRSARGPRRVGLRGIVVAVDRVAKRFEHRPQMQPRPFTPGR
jgi:hypothetical protein